MPKKLSTNTKSAEAREKKAAQKKSANDKAAKEAEDKLWEDDDKNLAKKKQKKEEEERKKAELLKKKAEKKALLEEEMASIKVTAKQSIQKITQAQIQAEVEKRNKVIENVNAPQKTEPKVVHPAPLEENLNRLLADTNFATTVDQAIAVLSVNDDEADRHPEKRMKAAYKAFEAEHLPRIKSENPTMRMSQWKQILHREWTKSSQNPINNRD
ncbi:hypothetical protein HA402_005681 [Bradysia odoriphaga]|nr:hypothetical protein HA402_005681 [Bradysia odoriphaga]